jgi:hypothetical protein
MPFALFHSEGTQNKKAKKLFLFRASCCRVLKSSLHKRGFVFYKIFLYKRTIIRGPFMKKKIASLLIAVLALLTLVAFAACTPEGEQLEGKLTIVLQADSESTATTYEVDLANFTESSSVADVLYYLSKTDNLYYRGTTSQYGLFMTEMGVYSKVYNEMLDYYQATYTPVVKEDSTTNTYISIYTNVEKDMSTYWTPVTYNGTKLYPSNYGVSGMSIADGAIIYFTQIVYTF